MHTSHARGVTDQMLTRWRLPYLTAMPEKISEIPASATPTATRHSLRIAKAIMTPWPTLLAASLTPHIVRGALPRLNAQLAAPTLGRPPAHSASHHHTVHGRPPPFNAAQTLSWTLIHRPFPRRAEIHCARATARPGPYLSRLQ